MTTEQRFDDWITALNLDVIQGEYGYEEGEFTVYPELWRPWFAEGLTPEQAFRRALNAVRSPARALGEQANGERREQ